MKAITYYPIISETRHRNALDCYERNLAFKNRLRRALLRGSRHSNMNGFPRLFHLRKNQDRDKCVDLRQQGSGGWVY